MFFVDLLGILRDRISAVPAGAHTHGLEAVLEHIDAAVEHLARGEQAGSSRAFTDAIYRTNQAFEGALKEAYRVLTGKPPVLRPVDIEGWLQNNKVVRQRVLDQFSAYRVNWRNASAHEHRANFDADEALLAIVTVTSFAIVLVGQIRDVAVTLTPAAPVVVRAISTFVPFVDKVAAAMESFGMVNGAGASDTNNDLLAAVVSHLRGSFPQCKVACDVKVLPSRPERVDIVIEDGSSRVAVEIARRLSDQGAVRKAVQSLADRMVLLRLDDGVLYVMNRQKIKGSLPGSANPRIIPVPQ